MVSVVSPSEILVTWDPVPPIDQNGIITMYEVYYQPLETFGGAIGPVVEDVVPPNISVILAQLEEYVFYNISIRAFTEVGPSDYTTALLVRTPEDGKYLVFYDGTSKWWTYLEPLLFQLFFERLFYIRD